MYCSISGTVPKDPVISVKSGHLYDRKLIEKALVANGNKCPETGEPLTRDDLISVKNGGFVAPVPPEKSSVPDVLSYVQTEWDGLTVELHRTKKQLQEVRQELATTLYRYDAALKVIGKLERERNGTTQAGRKKRKLNGDLKDDDASKGKEGEDSKDGQAVENGGADATASVLSLPSEVLERAKKSGEELQKKRKGKKSSGGLNAASVKAFREVNSITLDDGSGRITGISVKGKDMYAGCANGKLMYVKDMQMQNSIMAHEGGVNCVDYADGLILSGGVDGVVKIWDASLAEKQKFKKGYGAVVDVQRHPIGISLCCYEQGFKWYDTEIGTALGHGMENDINCGVIHPDGMVFALGGKGLGMWDLATMKKVASLGESKVIDVAMSEKGYYMAGCTEDGIEIWDLRKQQVVGSVEVKGCSGVAIDSFGEFGCAVGGEEVCFFGAKKRATKMAKIGWPSVTTGGRLGVCWGDGFVVAGDAGGALHRYER